MKRIIPSSLIHNTIENLVTKYSDYIRYPIKMKLLQVFRRKIKMEKKSRTNMKTKKKFKP